MQLSKIFNPKRFASELVIAKAKRYAATIYEAFGEKRFRWMIDNGRPLSEFMSEEMVASAFELSVEEFRSVRQQWGWTARAITDQQFRSDVLPPELQAILKESGGKGEAWCVSLIQWLRTQMGG